MWHTIPNYPDYEITKSGIVRRKANGRIKSIYFNDSGYKMVGVIKNGKSFPERLHRLLAFTFIPNPDNLPQINHKDGNKANIDISNLEWCTQSYNTKHAFATGLANNTGERNGMSKLTHSQVVEIKDLLLTGSTQMKISKMYGVSRSCILKIHLGLMWAHV